MRILFTAAPGYGLMLPIVPLAWAARAAGHEILLATTAYMTKVAAESGLLVADVFPERDVGEDLVAGAAGRRPEARDTPEGYWELVDAMRPFELFVLAMTEGTVAAGRAFRPDLVVHCSDHVAGRLAAVALDTPALEVGNRVSWSTRDEGFRHGGNHGARTGLVPDDSPVVTALRARLGLGDREPELLARIDPRAPSMGGLAGEEPDAEDGVPWLPMRYVPYNGGATLPSWAMLRPARPRICLTLGTIAPLLPGGGGLGPLIEALSGLDADVVLADSETDLSLLGPLPENVHPAGFVPLSGILRDCSLVVHHGGSGTTAAALHHGVPQLIVPEGADNALCARRVVDRKVGLSLAPGTADVPSLRALAERLLDEEAFARTAAAVRDEMAAQPSPAAIVERVVADLARRPARRP
ncbi:MULTISPECIES: nucleotide disphospho-sugar-binding domain-containing protein [unclassified Streptomyces]|uniref:nucleotide disphospho-sugar-binding domain-containing protein n=1 Tax=unclassified Streptomyces TaxID=2593676 RepID=UPI0015E193DE|nr:MULTISPECIES: nucleotide disphospho-sugar-binding domain-containing protein [unclassified Streptomyces]